MFDDVVEDEVVVEKALKIGKNRFLFILFFYPKNMFYNCIINQ